MAGSRPVTIVTGGSRGIGAAIVRRLARDGHDIVLTYRSRDDDAATVAAHARDAGAQTLVLRVDLADGREVGGLLPRAIDEFGTVTGLVNNAGITGRIGPFLDVPVEEMAEVLAVNALAPLVLCQAALAHMSTGAGGAGGSIVNISSGAARSGAPGTYIHYAASKGALASMTVGLAREFGPYGVRVNSVSPGTTLTEIHAAGGQPEAPAERAPGIPMRRPGEPDEIAAAVAYLMGPDASYTSGADIRVAGGA